MFCNSDSGEGHWSVALVMGSGTVKRPAGMTVKALRLTIGSDQNSWAIVRDPKIK